MSKRIKIVGDGTPAGTRVEVDGEVLAGVQSLRFTAGLHEKPMVVLEIKRPEIDVEIESGLGVVFCLAHNPVRDGGFHKACKNCGES